jgi:hypothetical protein
VVRLADRAVLWSCTLDERPRTAWRGYETSIRRYRWIAHIEVARVSVDTGTRTGQLSCSLHDYLDELADALVAGKDVNRLARP